MKWNLGKTPGLLSVLFIFTVLTLTACSDKAVDVDKATEIHIERSLAYQQQGQIRAAIIEARNIINLDRTRTTGYERLANIYLLLGHNKSAASILEHIGESSSAKIALTLATAYARQGKYLSTDKALQAYIDKGGDNQNIDYKLLLASVMAGNKQAIAATGLLKELIKQQPESLDARILLSVIYLKNNRLEDAATIISRTLELFPESPQALYMSAQIAHNQNKLADAERLLTEAIFNLPETDILLPMRLQTLASLATVLTQQGRTTEALVYAKLIASYSPEANDAKIKFGLALEQLNSGNIEAAEKLFEELYSAYPNNEKTAFYLGLINYHQGELDSANTIFNNHLDTETAPQLLIETAALNKLQLNKTRQAVSILEQALLTHNDNPLLLGLYGVSILQNPDTEETALLNIQKSLAINPDQDNLRLMLAKFYLKKAQFEQATAHLNIILKKDPGNIAANSIYLDSLLLEDNDEGAEQIARNLLKIKPNDPAALNLIAKYNLRNNFATEAKRLYLKSINIDPDNLEALNYLAYIAIEENSPQEAIDYYQKIILINPKAPFAYKSIAAILDTENGSQKALSTLLSYTQPPYSSDIKTTANAVCAEYYLLRDDLQKAARHIQVAKAGEYKTAYITSIVAQHDYDQAKEAIEKQDWATARSLLIQASNGSLQQLEVSQLLIEVELQSGQLIEARRLIQSMQKQHPREDSFILAKAKLYDLQGDTEKARLYLENQWQKSHSQTVAHNLYFRLKAKPADQNTFLLKWTKQDPDNHRPLNYLALNAQQAGNKPKAIKYYEQALELRPQSPGTLNNLAWLYYETGNPLAQSTAKRAYQLDPNSAAIQDTYGWIMIEAGNHEEGIELLEKALETAKPDELQGIKDHIKQATNS